MLEPLGIDSRAEVLYRAMLALPGAGIDVLSRMTGMSREEVCEALDLLSELALVKPAEPGRTAPGAGGGQFVGADGIGEKLAVLTRKVQHEVRAFAPGGAHSGESLRAAEPLADQLLARGVRMRTVHLNSVRDNPAGMAHIERLTGNGGEVRTAPLLPARMIILDRSCAVVAAGADGCEEGATVFREEGVLSALITLFEHVWASASPVGTVPRRDAAGLTPQERAVLECLYLGLTDEAVAHRLGVSPRTARRIANGLMRRLGSRSRFQAGALAVQRGWLQPRTHAS
ncbi:LuxR C-terminal-related transcriptional regulator [Streptomyces sp. NPDC049577]|uniref:helix-turn-helix transcriptional regulator n=1 Tax=Streptomyces sp. NPDC049577 TaxID=3155153 RepID=UPI003415B6C2